MQDRVANYQLCGRVSHYISQYHVIFDRINFTRNEIVAPVEDSLGCGTDFGLSEDVFLRNYYREGVDGEMTKLPFKWMAPESLSYDHFSEKSDVVGETSTFFITLYYY